MSMKPMFSRIRMVQKGKKMASPADVMERLKDIANNPKSSYHKSFKEGRIMVCYFADRADSTGKWDVMEVREMEPVGFPMPVCGECGDMFFDLGTEYLCEDCRA